VAAKPRQIFAFSGVVNRPPEEKPDPAFLEYVVSLAAGSGVTQVCFIPTATGDSPGAIEAVSDVFTGREDVDFSVLRLFTQPNVPDVRAHLLGQDVLLVGGGSVVNLMAVWRAHGLAPVMRECWEAGVVLAGWSAGSLCWHVGGPTDSFGDSLDIFTDGLGFLPYSNGS
jgi:peptidase E